VRDDERSAVQDEWAVSENGLGSPGVFEESRVFQKPFIYLEGIAEGAPRLAGSKRISIFRSICF
jgi:hypothetical protein